MAFTSFRAKSDYCTEYTCFANSLSQLTRLPGPIRDVAHSDALLPERLAINAPREVMRLVNWMMTNTVEPVRASFEIC